MTWAASQLARPPWALRAAGADPHAHERGVGPASCAGVAWNTTALGAAPEEVNYFCDASEAARPPWTQPSTSGEGAGPC